MEDVDTIGSRLRAARVLARLSQAQLAEASGITVMTINRMERGEQANPQLETLRALAKALGIRATDLIPEDQHR